MQFLKSPLNVPTFVQQKLLEAAVSMSEMLNLIQQSSFSPAKKNMDNVCLYFPQVHFLTSLQHLQRSIKGRPSWPITGTKPWGTQTNSTSRRILRRQHASVRAPILSVITTVTEHAHHRRGDKECNWFDTVMCRECVCVQKSNHGGTALFELKQEEMKSEAPGSLKHCYA